MTKELQRETVSLTGKTMASFLSAKDWAIHTMNWEQVGTEYAFKGGAGCLFKTDLGTTVALEIKEVD